MRVCFDSEALSDLEDIFDWIAKDDVRIARVVIAHILNGIERLGTFPRMGRAGRDKDTREWVVTGLPYIVVYEIDMDRDELVVVAVFHGARRRKD